MHKFKKQMQEMEISLLMLSTEVPHTPIKQNWAAIGQVSPATLQDFTSPFPW